MPLLMPGAWKRNKLVVHTTPYDLTILDARPVLSERRSSISVPTLVIGGEKSLKGLRDAVASVANALPNGESRFLPGQDHNISGPALVPVLVEFFARARLVSLLICRSLTNRDSGIDGNRMTTKFLGLAFGGQSA